MTCDRVRTLPPLGCPSPYPHDSGALLPYVLTGKGRMIPDSMNTTREGTAPGAEIPTRPNLEMIPERISRDEGTSHRGVV